MAEQGVRKGIKMVNVNTYVFSALVRYEAAPNISQEKTL